MKFTKNKQKTNIHTWGAYCIILACFYVFEYLINVKEYPLNMCYILYFLHKINLVNANFAFVRGSDNWVCFKYGDVSLACFSHTGSFISHSVIIGHFGQPISKTWLKVSQTSSILVTCPKCQLHYANGLLDISNVIAIIYNFIFILSYDYDLIGITTFYIQQFVIEVS